MGQIEACTEALALAIRESSEYREFCDVRDKVVENPELRHRINAFRRHVFEVQNSREPLDMYGEMERISRDYEDFRREPLVNDFLQSELRVCRIIQRIMQEISQAVDLDTDEFTDGMTLM